jgi:hypothetical protein
MPQRIDPVQGEVERRAHADRSGADDDHRVVRRLGRTLVGRPDVFVDRILVG